jgi:uncharacterized protein (DUF983 family)
LIFRCPRCGVGPLFAGMLKLQPKCVACGLDFKPYDQGDGPAAFAIFFVAIPIVGGALLVQRWFSPPVWVHAFLWLPATVGLTILVLRVIKGWLVQQQFKHLPPAAPPQ